MRFSNVYSQFRGPSEASDEKLEKTSGAPSTKRSARFSHFLRSAYRPRSESGNFLPLRATVRGASLEEKDLERGHDRHQHEAENSHFLNEAERRKWKKRAERLV